MLGVSMRWTSSHTREPQRSVTGDGSRDTSATTTRGYSNGARSFELLLTRMVLRGEDFWTVERVMDVSCACKFVVIPGMQKVTASTPDAVFARACDCIDKWLWRSL